MIALKNGAYSQINLQNIYTLTPEPSPSQTRINSPKIKTKHQKRQRGPSSDLTELSTQKKIKSKSIFNTVKGVYRISEEQADKTLMQCRKIKDSKFLLKFGE